MALYEFEGYCHEGTFFLWHRCDEELPEEKTTVLVTDELGNVTTNMIIGGAWANNAIKAIAWGKLPTPYTGVKITNG